MNVDTTKSDVNGSSWMLRYNFDFLRRCNTVVPWHDNPENEFPFKTSCLFWPINTLRRQVFITNFKFLMASPSELSYSSGFSYTLVIALDWFPSYFIQKPTRVLMNTLNAIDLLNNDVKQCFGSSNMHCGSCSHERIQYGVLLPRSGKFKWQKCLHVF